MTDYVLKATYFDQAVERDEKGLPTKVVKHYQGAVVSDLDEAEAVRLLACGAVVLAEVQSAPAKPKRAPAKSKRAPAKSKSAPAATGEESDQSNTDGDADSDDGGDDLDGLEGDDGDGSDDDEGAAGRDGPAPKGTLPKPPNTADLELWVAYAVDQGLDEDEAKGMDRAALIKALA